LDRKVNDEQLMYKQKIHISSASRFYIKIWLNSFVWLSLTQYVNCVKKKLNIYVDSTQCSLPRKSQWQTMFWMRSRLSVRPVTIPRCKLYFSIFCYIHTFFWPYHKIMCSFTTKHKHVLQIEYIFNLKCRCYNVYYEIHV
jgi:hypothetical protein